MDQRNAKRAANAQTGYAAAKGEYSAFSKHANEEIGKMKESRDVQRIRNEKDKPASKSRTGIWRVRKMDGRGRGNTLEHHWKSRTDC